MDGPFFDVDLGPPPRPRAKAGFAEAVKGFVQLARGVGTHASLSLKGRVSAAKDNMLDLVAKAKHGLASARQGLSRQSSATDGRTPAPLQATTPPKADVVTQTASSPRTPTTPNEIAEHTFRAVTTNIPNEKTFLRNDEIKYADSAMRGAVLNSVKPSLDALISSIRHDAAAAAIKEPSPATVNGFDARGHTERLLENVQNYKTSLYGDGSDASLSRLVDSFGKDYQLLAFAKRQAVVHGTPSSEKQRALSDIMSGQEGSLRTTAPYITTERAEDPDGPGSGDLLFLSKVLQWASSNSKDKIGTEKVPEDMKPRVENAISDLHSIMLRVGDIAARKGAATGNAVIAPLVMQNILASEEIEDMR